MGEATQYMGGGWQTAMDHPIAVGAAVGVAVGLAVYGPAAIITQAQIGINLGRLSELPMNSRVDTVPKYGFDAIKNATGLTKSEAIQTIQSSGRSLLDLRNGGNINNIANVGEKVIRITTTPNASKIISAGVISGASKVANYISSGSMRAIPTVTYVAKTVTQFISNLAK